MGNVTRICYVICCNAFICSDCQACIADVGASPADASAAAAAYAAAVTPHVLELEQ